MISPSEGEQDLKRQVFLHNISSGKACLSAAASVWSLSKKSSEKNETYSSLVNVLFKIVQVSFSNREP